MSHLDMSVFEAVAAGIGRYFVDDPTVDATLQRVADLGLKALPMSSDVGITLTVAHRPCTRVYTATRVVDIDDAQYANNDGPSLDAMEWNEPRVIGSTREHGRWRHFRMQALEHGVLSTMSLPMRTQGGTVGALNFYAPTEDAYREPQLRVGALFAQQGAFVLAYWEARNKGDDLLKAMESRATIDQAKGIIMATMRCTPDEAMTMLISHSQHQNEKLRTVAAEIVRSTATRRS
jgi:hypothetical protein